jgi:hypothetical protein
MATDGIEMTAAAAELVARGAKAYAAARRPETVDIPGVTPVRHHRPRVRRAAEIASTSTFS